MAVTLRDLRPIYVVGIGWHRYQFPTETTYVELGLTAVRASLHDAGVAWAAVESAYVAKALLPMAPGRRMLKHLGATGIPIVHVENASASGSAAFGQACLEVGAGIRDLTVAVGVDKPGPWGSSARLAGIPSLADDAIAPFTHFAMLADRYSHRWGVPFEDIARVAVKNHRNGSKNPFAQHQKVRTLEEILGGRAIAGGFTSLQCTPVGEGAAAVLVASEHAIQALGIDSQRAIQVLSSVGRSERVSHDGPAYDAELTAETTQLALNEAKVQIGAVDVIELHDAFTIEELEYLEAMGVCPEGQAAGALKDGEFDIGGRCAVNPSGGLIAMGHPLGPTGIGQIAEIVKQLRGEAGPRQQPGATVGLAHMVGIGSVCYVHVLAA